MEVCGGQTHAIVRFALDETAAAGDHADPRSGLPGLRHADRNHRQGVAIASRPEVIFCSFGDMLRVPGSDEGPA